MLGHTSQQFEAELRQLKDRLLAMGARCEQMITLAIRALESQDAKLAQEVEDTDREINAEEVAIDDLAARILALRQPVGRDLRFILSALKVVTDLERIGDEAVNIAERARRLATEPELPAPHVELPEMAALATGMLHEALDSFVDEDADKAREVLLKDDAVDDVYGRLLDSCIDFMSKNPTRVRQGMRIASCAKYLERVADHATNIAEMVVYLVRGVDVRHHGNR